MGSTVLIDVSRFDVGDRVAEQIRIALINVIRDLNLRTKKGIADGDG